MEKKYVKPDVYVEHFEMSQSIASGCSINSSSSTVGTPGYSDPYSCSWTTGTEIFFYEVEACKEGTIGENVEIWFGCYHNPSASTTIFSS